MAPRPVLRRRPLLAGLLACGLSPERAETQRFRIAFTLLLHLPRMTNHGLEARVKNGPALAGHGAEAVCDAITRTIITLPEQLRVRATGRGRGAARRIAAPHA